MTKEEKIQYLANLYYLIKIDGKVEDVEDRFLTKAAGEIGAGPYYITHAKNMALEKGFSIQYPKRYSDRIKNVEDMLLLAYSDKRLHKLEKKIIQEYIKEVSISKDQLKVIQKEAKERWREYSGTCAT